MPTNLAADTSTGEVKLTWNASSDTSGVKEYQVYRGTVMIGTATAPTTSFTDATGIPGTTYAYSVAAEDTVGNVSAKSSPALQVQYPQNAPPPSSGAIELRDSTTATNDAEKTLTVPVPTTQPGDLLLASVAFRGKGSVSTPAGWTLVRQDASGTAIQLVTYSAHCSRQRAVLVRLAVQRQTGGGRNHAVLLRRLGEWPDPGVERAVVEQGEDHHGSFRHHDRR